MLIKHKLNGQGIDVVIKTAEIVSRRRPFNIKLTHAIQDGETIKEISVDKTRLGNEESAFLRFIETGCPTELQELGFECIDDVESNQVARSASFINVKTCATYTICGIGLIKKEPESNGLMLLDPEVDNTYGEYQEKIKSGLGGTKFFNENGWQVSKNTVPLGCAYYEETDYSIKRKIKETLSYAGKGIQTPEFILAGQILDLGNEEFGFYVYKSGINPGFMENLHLFISDNGKFSLIYLAYLECKYKQLYKIHEDIKETHGQFTVTNTPLNFDERHELKDICQIKDFDTNRRIPESKERVLIDGICSKKTGWYVSISARVAAKVYDIHLSLLQEMYVLQKYIAKLENDQTKFDYIANQVAGLMITILKHYPLINDEKVEKEVVMFGIKVFHKSLLLGEKIENFNFILSGAMAHAMYYFSKQNDGEIMMIEANSLNEAKAKIKKEEERLSLS